MLLGRYLSLPVLFIAVVIQTALFPFFQLRGGRLDLTLLLVLIWTLLAGAEEGIIWAIVGGVIADIASGYPMGLSALCMVIVMIGVGLTVGSIERPNILVVLLATLIVSPVYHGMMAVSLTVLGRPIALIDSVFNVILPTVVLNILVSYPLYRIVGAFYWRALPKRVG
jgi:rod shape-determining protein MreD